MTYNKLPEAQCLEDGIHEQHAWRSLTHRWWCPGRTMTRAERLRRAQVLSRLDREEGRMFHQVGELEL